MSPYRLITAVVLAALAGSATGCTAIALSSTQGDPNPYSGNDAGVGTDGGNYLVDAMTPGDAVTTSPVSPLCTSPSAKCRPDDSKLSSLVSSCGLAPYVDAGTDADASAAPAAKLACPAKLLVVPTLRAAEAVSVPPEVTAPVKVAAVP